MSKKKQNERMEDDGTYVVPKNRKANIFAFIVCFLVALLIWVYATNLDNKQKSEEENPPLQRSVAVAETALL